MSSSNLHFRLLKNGKKKQETLTCSSFKYNKTLKKDYYILFLEQRSERCLQQSKDCQKLSKKSFHYVPNCILHQFHHGTFILIKVCTRTDEVRKITDVFVSSSIRSAGSLLQNTPEESQVRASCFLIPQIF